VIGLAASQPATSAGIDIAVLVFREGLECVLVLAAITANMVGDRRAYQRPVFSGAAVAFLATLLSWRLAVAVVDDMSASLPALQVQAITGMLAVVVLLLVMNWFFHKVYWTGWITMHSRTKQDLLRIDAASRAFKPRVWWGLALLGFTSLYREGFEVVLFLQSYRLRLGDAPVALGVAVGLVLTAVVAVLTFVAHRRLAYRKMLVLTGMLLGVVLLVMVGEQAQEMQQARWLPRTILPGLAGIVPAWLGTWFSVFPTVETLVAQTVAALLVLLSYLIARPRSIRHVAGEGTNTFSLEGGPDEAL
jgi:high-affinity iron transporter